MQHCTPVYRYRCVRIYIIFAVTTLTYQLELVKRGTSTTNISKPFLVRVGDWFDLDVLTQKGHYTCVGVNVMVMRRTSVLFVVLLFQTHVIIIKFH